MDLSILIVHYNTPELLRKTLEGILRVAPNLKYEVIVVDNNPDLSIKTLTEEIMPEARVICPGENIGFGRGMNRAMEAARGRYYLIFNPDIILFKGALERMVRFLDDNPDVGVVGPKLCNPDGSLQYSCYRFMEPKTVLYRRLPFLRALPHARRHIRRYLMADWAHNETRDVDYLLGAVMMVRRKAVNDVGHFDPGYFMYFEDQDWCRRFWKAGWRVVYYSEATMYHYHRRETAEGGFLKQILNPLTRIQLQSAIYYYRKFRGESNPRHVKNQTKSHA